MMPCSNVQRQHYLGRALARKPRTEMTSCGVSTKLAWVKAADHPNPTFFEEAAPRTFSPEGAASLREGVGSSKGTILIFSSRVGNQQTVRGTEH